ncbi:MAG: hypothetical protein QOG31_1662 [Thermoplasmata archaeon]|jgi:hypothetical protein|nr:hypothetical protein [Thermoplasmata archaeon]
MARPVPSRPGVQKAVRAGLRIANLRAPGVDG